MRYNFHDFPVLYMLRYMAFCVQGFKQARIWSAGCICHGPSLFTIPLIQHRKAKHNS